MTKAVRALVLEELRKRKSSKWRQYPSDVLPLPVAEMDFPMAPAVKAGLQDMLDRSDTGYLGAFPELFEAFAKFSKSRWSWQPDITQMRMATDVGVGIVEVMRTLIKAGDKVMLNSPVYENIWKWIAEVHAELVDVPLAEDGLNYKLDLEAIEREYAKGVKLHILCHPHNPVGIIHTRSELETVAILAKKYGVIVLSDEIHGPLTFNKKEFFPFLSVSDNAKEVGIIITSASKSFNFAGLKCALIITESIKLKEKINTMPPAVTWRASLFGAVASTSAYSDSEEWLDGVLITLDENRNLVKKLIDTKIPTIKYRIPDFGYLAWFDVSSLGLGSDPAAQILERSKLALNAGVLYGPKHSNFVRFNFGTSEEIINQAFERLIKVL
ncbi:cystathione beta-lyase [Candidatus Nanopelagicus abundans]|uniref:cysteine-S-conjugate beta-lyase n=1 Tax=Candidatus Nanopelagicus abundans TaxID=1884916 RepID=A0A249L4Z2_9ACTN|nr:aminotransferase class I/II-fold pyridoxal phosphate-dependent enzyme [Candidatus Nanopelagicus abundans]ASY24160.1 cystathione beta-lyase [Candidatus Nanopelagicus abundans]